MSRLTYLIALTVALVALTASVQAGSNGERCGPIHDLYKQAVAKCTQDNNAIPNSDADPRWKPCICSPGFYPLAIAAENCLTNNSGVNQLTADALSALCKDYPGFTAPAQQTAPPALGAALASVTSIASMPVPTGSTDGPKGAATNMSPSAALYTALMAVTLVAAGHVF
ncbi:hypothetical protein DFQ26_007316 [Actinomortierella ambigua]|nr:hypothetical protein DFQ26_007316 [Actinomortierella ambigua]